MFSILAMASATCQMHSFPLYSKMRVTVEQAIGKLKGIWRILLRGIYARKENSTKCIVACVVLHNYLRSLLSSVPVCLAQILLGHPS